MEPPHLEAGKLILAGVTIFSILIATECRTALEVIRNYNNNVPPPHADIDLVMGVRYSNLLDIKNKDQIMSSRFRVSLEYTDSRLAWGENIPNPQAYKIPLNMTRTARKPHENAIIVPGEMVWSPVLMMMNSVIMTKTAPEVALIESNGRVILRKYWKADTTCNLNLGSFPYDVQKCSLIFDVVSFGVFIQHKPKRLELVTSESKVGDLEYFVQNSEWQIIKQRARIVKDESNFAAVVEVVVSRRGMYYIQFLLAPGVVITLIAFFGFLLPADGGQYKATLGVTCLLSMAVFRLSLQKHLNPDEEAVNVLGLYLDALSGNIALIVMSSIFTVYLHNMGLKPMPHPPSLLSLCLASAIARTTRRPVKHAVLQEAIRRRRKMNSKGGGGDETNTNTSANAKLLAVQDKPNPANGMMVPYLPSQPAGGYTGEGNTLLISVRQRIDNGNIVAEQAGVKVLPKDRSPTRHFAQPVTQPPPEEQAKREAAEKKAAEETRMKDLVLEWKLIAQQINMLLFFINLSFFIFFSVKIWYELYVAG